MVEENSLLRLVLEELPHGLCMFDGQDCLVLANRRYAELWGIPEALTQPGTAFKTIMAASTVNQNQQTGLKAMPPAGWSGVHVREWTLRDGRIIQVTVTRLPDASTIALHEDVTERRRSQEQVVFLAEHDQLTGLLNLAAMRSVFEQLLIRNVAGDEFAVLCLDLDKFKRVNDSFGHAVGDRLLAQVALRIQSCLHHDEQVARLGGDEFLILQCGASQPGSSKSLAKRVIAALSEPFNLGNSVAQIGVSVGIAIAPFDGTCPEDLLKHADLALYRAKADGRGTWRYFEPLMNAKAEARRALEADLRVAMALGQFHLVYQPQVSLLSRKVTGLEALLRWQHPKQGNISPVEFIGLAEETGLIVEIGRWVLAQACLDAMQWPANLRVAVNVSAVQFAQGNLLRDVRNALESAALPPDRLEIEITESVLMQDEKQSLGAITELRDLGVYMALDDFGTGFSSLSYLLNFPLHRLKIDRSFVQNVATNPNARSIVRAIAGLGNNLGLAITVEGVETLEQLKVVRSEGCTEVQGFLFSQPVLQKDVCALVHNLNHSPIGFG